MKQFKQIISANDKDFLKVKTNIKMLIIERDFGVIYAQSMRPIIFSRIIGLQNISILYTAS